MRRWQPVAGEAKTWKIDVAIGRLLYPEKPAPRPRTRADCVNGLRPCPWLGCQHNLNLEVTKQEGVRTIDAEPWDPAASPSCALDVAELGGGTLEQVGFVFGITRERVRQIEARALRKLAAKHPELEGVIAELQRIREAADGDLL